MGRRGSKPGERRGGRQKGTPNKATAAREAAVKASGLTPLEYMLKIMRNRKLPRDVRLDAARSAAPYVHPKRASVEHRIPDPIPIASVPASVTDSQAMKAYMKLIKGES